MFSFAGGGVAPAGFSSFDLKVRKSFKKILPRPDVRGIETCEVNLL